MSKSTFNEMYRYLMNDGKVRYWNRESPKHTPKPIKNTTEEDGTSVKWHSKVNLKQPEKENR